MIGIHISDIVKKLFESSKSNIYNGENFRVFSKINKTKKQKQKGKK